MSRVPGTNLLATRTAPRIETFLSSAAISVGDLVFMVAASNKLNIVAVDTDILTTNTGSGVVGIALTPASATDQPVQVQIIDSDTELVLPASTGATPATTFTYALRKASTGTYANALAVNMGTTLNGVCTYINKDQDALGMARITTGSTAGVFTTNPALVTPTIAVTAGDLIRVSIAEAARWYKG